MEKRLMSAALKQKFLSGDENLCVTRAYEWPSAILILRSRAKRASRRMIQEAAPQQQGLGFEATPSASRRGRGDLGEQRQNMQLAVEIELFRLALCVSNAVPKLANLLHPEEPGSTSRA